jgi:CDP-diacylglycerol--inositol 3-phosphatidyltransferase
MLALDILSHFARLFATMSGGSKSHKDVSETSNIFLKYYYGNRVILFTLCAGHEGAFLLLYLVAMLSKMGADPNGLVGQIVLYLLYFNLPLCAIKEWMNAVQFWQSMVDIVAIDMEERRKAGLEPSVAGTKKAESKPAPKSPKSPASPKASSARKKKNVD